LEHGGTDSTLLLVSIQLNNNSNILSIIIHLIISNKTLLELSQDDDSMCDVVYDSVKKSLVAGPEEHFVIASAVLQWIMCGLGMTMELLQLYSTPARYISSPTNAFDWFTYIAVLITLIPVHPCYIATVMNDIASHY
jgi:hypothetical protein